MIRSCTEINIRTFVKVKFEKQFELLGYDNEQDARAAFEAIETEYNDATGFRPPQLREVNKKNELIARFNVVQGLYKATDEALSKLDGEELLYVIAEIIPRLKKQGVRIVYSGDIKDFPKAYKTAQIREKSNEIKLREMMQKQTEGDAREYTIDDFYTLLRAVQRLQGFNISEIETNMRNFAGMVKEYFELVRKQGAKEN